MHDVEPPLTAITDWLFFSDLPYRLRKHVPPYPSHFQTLSAWGCCFLNHIMNRYLTTYVQTFTVSLRILLFVEFLIFSQRVQLVYLLFIYIYIYRYTMIHLYIYIHIIDRYIIYLLYRLITKRTRLPHRLVKVCDILHLQGGDPAVRDSLQTKILWYIYYIMYIIYNYIYTYTGGINTYIMWAN